jgi:hypothetical protein
MFVIIAKNDIQAAYVDKKVADEAWAEWQRVNPHIESELIELAEVKKSEPKASAKASTPSKSS